MIQSNRSPKALLAIHLQAVLVALAFCFTGQTHAAAPDLTAGGVPNDNDQWNLGPTGMAGWCYREGVRTTNARQFLVKTVEPGSPANGIMAVNDVILGASGTGAEPVNFTEDARVAFAKAITDAEERNPATLKILRWRAGVTSTVSITLETLGAYSATAPYDCPKSQAILEKGLQNMMNTGANDNNWRYSALTLLAGNNPANPNNAVRQAKAHAELRQLILPAETIALYSTAKSQSKDAKPWHIGPKLIALSEYYLKTGDPDVLPSIRAYALCIAHGQSMFGTCGHFFSNPGYRNVPVNGPYNVGYGPVNNAALPCYIGLILANKCGLTDPEILAGIQRAGTFYAQYTHLGCAGYGEHTAYEGHDTNGKAGLQALAFQLEGNRLESTRYYAKSSAAAAIQERDTGHTGSFFAFLYAPLGANVGGPDAMAYYFRETKWMYELARKWDGGFVYNSFASGGVEEGDLVGQGGCLMSTPMLLTYAMPLRQTFLTGKDQNPANWISPAEMVEVQAASTHYYTASTRTTAELLSDLGSWSPRTRRSAARELKARTSEYATTLPALHAMATNEAASNYSRIGACAAIGEIADSNSVPVLLSLVTHPTYVVRYAAASAINGYRFVGGGTALKPHVVALMQACIDNQKPLLPLDPVDPMQTVNGHLCSALFAPHAALYTHDLVGLDRPLLYGAMRVCAANAQADVRKGLSTIYSKLTQTDIEQVADALVEIAYDNAPAGMGVIDSRIPSISFMQSKGRAEGVPLAIRFAEDMGYEDGDIVSGINVLADYAGSSNTVTPDPDVEHFCNILIASGAKYGIPEAQAVLSAIAADTNPEVLKPFKSIDWVIPDDPVFDLPKNWTTLRVTARNHSNPNPVYTWRKLRGAGSVSFTPNGTNAAKNTIVVFDGTPGEYEFEVTMSDSHGLTEVSKTVTVTLRNSSGNLPPNSPPTADGQTVAASPGTPTQIILTGSDPEGYALNYAVTAPPTKGFLSGSVPHLVYTASANATGSDSFTFEVEDSEGQTAAATVNITLGAGSPVGLAIYEPFNYAAGNLQGKSGSSEIGLSGTWTAASQITIESPSLTYGTLPVSGNRVKSVSIGNPGGSRPISASALAARGLMDNGATLWFSVVMGGYGGWNSGGNAIDLALANNSFPYGPNIPNNGTVPGSGLGVRLWNKGVYAAQYFDTTVGPPLTGDYDNTVTGGIINDQPRLVVGKITWGAASDTVEIYLPGSNMVLPSQPTSTLTANVDQSTFNLLTFSRGQNVLLDEIRFGATLQSVLQGTVDMSQDLAPPVPNPMSFAVAPAPSGASSITMTATPAWDGMGVEYYFTCTAGGGNHSGWQDSNVYTDTGLSPGIAYSYTVKARDKHPALNETTASAALSATIPATGTVPAVEGLPQALAQTLITNSSLSVGTVTMSASYSMTVPAGCVLSQSPLAGNSAAYGSPVNLVISIGQDPVLPVLDPADIVDNRNGETVELGTPVTYTLTFSKDIDASTLDTGDFTNAGDIPIIIDSIAETSPGVVAVTVTPDGALAGNLRFAVAAGSVIKDTSANDLNTSSAIIDDTVITVIPIQPKTQIFTGTNSGNTDNWNTAINWNSNAGPIPTGTDNVLIPAGKQVTSNSSATPVYGGNLTLASDAHLQAGYSLSDINIYNCLGTPGSTTISMGEASRISLRYNFSPVFPAITLQGNAEITMGSSTSPGTDPVFNHPITGPYTLALSGKSDCIANLNVPNNFRHLRMSTQYGTLFTVNANTAGSLSGDVTVMADYTTGGKGANLVFNAANAMSDTATLTLYGNTGSLVTVNFNDTIGTLKLNGVKQLPGTYNSGNSSWISGAGTLTVNGATMAYWNPVGGPSGTWNDSDIWNTQVDLAGGNNPWVPGQIGVFNSTGTYGVTLEGDKEIGGLSVASGSVTLTGGGLSLSDDAPIHVASGASLTLGTLVSQNFAGLGLHKSGAGNLVLASENTFTGPVTIGGGTLTIATIGNAGSPSALGQYPDPGIGGLYLAGGTLRYTGGNSSVDRGFTFTGNSTIEIGSSGSALTLGDVETAGPGTLTVTGGAGSTLGLGNIRIVQGNGITLNPNNISMSVGSVEGYSAYPIGATITLGGSSTGNVVTGSIFASAYPGSAYQQGTGVVKTGAGEWKIAGAMTAVAVSNFNVTANDGTLILSGNNTFLGSTAVNNLAKLVLDYTTNNTSKLATAELRAAGGTIELLGGSHIEVVGSTTLNAGPSAFITRNGGTAKLRMNNITRNAQSSVAFLDGTVADTDRANTNGILGGYATVGTDWAVNSTNGTDGAITALSSYDVWTSSGGASTANYLLGGSNALTGSLAANSLKIVNTDVNQSLNIGSNNLTITSTAASTLGGILYAAGANNQYSINGSGAILASTTTGELIVHTAAGALTVNAPVVTSGATAGLLTKTGDGSLILGGNNVYTGTTRVSKGKLFINGSLSNVSANLLVDTGASLGGSGTVGRNITIANGAGLEFTLGTPAASHVPLTRGTSRTMTFSGSSVLTINAGANAAPGLYTLITGGNNITGAAPATVILPPGWSADPPVISGAQLRINITSVVAPPANSAPAWAADPVDKPGATEDAAYSATLANDATDANGDVLTFRKTSGPAWLTVATDGTLSGTPLNSDVGSNSFTVSVSDGIAPAVQTTVNIPVINTNDVPVWSGDPLIGPAATEDAAYSHDMSLAASDADAGAVLTFAKTSGPAWLSVASNGIISGIPANSDVGLNVFTVSVSDGIATPVQTTLQITVLNTNDAPFWTANPINGGNTVRDLPYSGTLAGIAGDDDADASLTFSKLSGPTWLNVASNGALSGTPAIGDLGLNAFTVGVNDGIAATVSSTLNINVINANVAPVAQAQSVSTNEDTALPITLVGTDDDGNPLTYAIVTQPAKGTLSGTPPNVTYTPDANENGSDSFTFKVNDSVVDSDIATISITINPINDAPVFTADPIVFPSVTETVSYTGQTLAGTVTDVDAGDTLTYSKVSGPSWLSVASNGVLSGTPPMGSSGLNSFVVRVTDSASAEADAILQITVNLYALIWDANGTAAGQTNGGGAWLSDFLWYDNVLNSNINILNSGTNKWVSGANATFGGQSTNGGAVTLASPTTVNILTFNTFTGTYTLGTASQTITLNGGINKTSASGIVSMISPFVLGAGQTWSNNSSNTLTASSTMDLGSNTLTVDGTGTTSLTGVISGSGHVVKNGSGRLTFHTGNANTYTGNTTINGGVLMMANNLGSLGSGNVTINGGILESYWGLTLTRALGAGNGEIQLTGGASGFGQNGGGQTLIVNFGNNSANEAVWGSSTFNPSTLTFHSPAFTGTSSVTLMNKIDMNGATRTIQVNGGASGDCMATLSGAIRSSSGTAGLVKTGAGILTLSAANTYTGGSAINEGALRFESIASMPSSGVVALSSGTRIGIAIGGGGQWTAGTSGAGTLGGLLAGTGGAGSSTVTYNGDVGLMLVVNGSTNYGGTLANPAGASSLRLQKLGTALLTLSGSNSYTGATSLTQGTLSINSIGNVGGGNSSLGAPATVAAGTINLGNSNSAVTLQYTGSGHSSDRVLNLGNTTGGVTLDMSGTGTLTFTSALTATGAGSKTLTLTGSSAGTGVLAGAIPNNSGTNTTALTKTGTGTWTLGGNNTYTGATAVNAGKLFINGNQSSAAGSVSVAAGATLGGTGTIGGNTTIAAGGMLEFNIGPNSASHDPLELVSGKTLTFSGTSTLTITSSSGASPGIYTLVSGGNNIVGAAPATLNLPSGWAATVSISGNSLLLDVTATGDATPGSLSIAGTNGLTTSGYVGGPFSPTSVVYTLSNPGQTAINWTASKTTGWVDLSATSGTLAGGANTTVTVSLHANANLLAAGVHNDVVTFTNTTNGTGNTSRDVTLTANARPTYVVTFDGNGNTDGSSPSDQTKTLGIDLTLSGPGSLVRTGHSFSHWNTAANGSGMSYAAGATYSTDAPLVLYAQWTVNNYNVTYDANGGGAPSATNQSVTYGSTYGTLATVSRTGYSFNGWFTAASGGSQIIDGATVSIAADHTLYAQWTADTYSVTFDPNGGDAPVPSGKSVTYDSPYGALADVSRAGYTFSGWFTAPSGGTEITSVTTVTITANQTLYARWTAEAYMVTFDANGGDTPIPDNKTVTHNETYGTLATASRPGYTFDGWFTAPSGGTQVTSATTVSITAAQTLYAHWTVNTYTVTFDANGGDAPTPTNITVTYDAAYGTLATASRTGYTFDGWFTAASGGSEVTSASTVAITADQTLYARWTANAYTVTFDANGGDAPTPANMSVSYGSPYGTLASVTRSGFVFSGWFTAAVGGTQVSAATTVSTASDHTLFAQWSQSQPEIDVTHNATSIPSGGYSATSGTNAGAGAPLTFVISNSGSVDLALGSATTSGASNCTVNISTQPAGSVAPAGTTNLVLTVTPTAGGAWSFAVVVPNNDANENPYLWTVHGVAGQTTTTAFPASADTYLNGASPNTPYGSANTIALNRRNTQNRRGLINFDLPTITAGVTVSSASLQFVAAGGQAGSVEIFDTLGSWNAATATSNNSSAVIGNTSYGSATITTTTLGSAVPDIILGASARTLIEGWIGNTVARNGFSIKTDYTSNNANSVTVCSADHTTESYRPKLTVTYSHTPVAPETHVARAGYLVADGGTDNVAGSFVATGTQLVYQVANLGNADLSLTTPVSLVADSNCSVTVDGEPAGTLAPSAIGNLLVTVTPTAAGPWSATLSIINNDPDEAPYNWTISGTATGSYTVTYDGNNATSGTVPSNQTKNHGVSLTLAFNTGTLARTGYTFAGWNTQADGLGTSFAEGASYTTNAALTLYAKWTMLPYTAWADSSGLTGGDAGPGVDPDGDGLTNLQEFAFGTNPASGRPGPIQVDQDGKVVSPGLPDIVNFAAPTEPADFRAVFPRRKDHTMAGLTYTVEFSADLTRWTASNDGLEVLSTGSAGAVDAVSVPFPATVPVTAGGPAQPPKFFRVAVE